FLEGRGFSKTLGEHITALEQRQAGLAAKLADARQEAAHPLSETWGEAQTLIDTLAAAPDPRDARLRLRAALRRIVEVIQLLIVPRGQDRLCAVQIHFRGKHAGRQRNYLVLHRPASGRRPASWSAASFKEKGLPGDLDLRRQADTRALERALLTVT